MNHEWKEDLNLPEGWKCRDNLGQQKDRRTIIAADGTVFLSGRCALEGAIEKGESLEVIKKLRNFLKSEGWMENSNLPEDWMLKHTNKRTLYLTEKGKCFRTFIEAKEYLKSEMFSEDDIERFNSFDRSYSSKVVSSAGNDEWTEDDDLPAGWQYKKKGTHHILLSREGTVLRSLKKGVEFVKQSDVYTEEDERKLRNFINKLGVCAGSIANFHLNRTRWLEDATAPKGWRIRLKRNGKQIFLSPCNKILSSRRRALEFMIKEDYPEEDIFTMKGFLHMDDWKDHEKLPGGWKYKETDNYAVRLMNDQGCLLNSLVLGINYMKSNGYEEKDIEHLKIFVAETRQINPSKPASRTPGREVTARKIRLPSSPNFESDITVPSDWKTTMLNDGRTILLSPRGETLKSRKAALKYMTENNSTQEEIQSMSSFLRFEGWKDNQNLPNGWKYKDLKKTNHHIGAASKL